MISAALERGARRPCRPGSRSPRSWRRAALSMMSSASPSSQCGRRVQVAPPAGASAPTSPSSGTSRASSLAPGPDRDVRLLAADRDVRVGRVRDAQQQVVELAPRPRPGSASSAVIRSPAATDAALRSATSGPSGAAPPLIASPICLRGGVALGLEGLALAEQRAAARASSSRARSTSAGSSPLSMAPWRMTSGSSRSRCSPTLIAAASRTGLAAGRPQPSSRPIATKIGSRLASSQPARGPFARPRNAR